MNNETYFEFDEAWETGFTTIPNYILNDTRLSYKAVGVYVQIIQYKNSNKHKVYLSSLSNYRTDRKSAVSSAMKELIETGYIEKHQLRNEKGQLNGVKYVIKTKPSKSVEISTDEPIPNNQTSAKKPNTKKPNTKNQKTANVPLKTKYYNNKIDNKQNINTTQSTEVVDKNIQLIKDKTHLNISNNMQKKIMSWDYSRLIKAVNIFNKQDGEYFTLLEKIYKDDKNYISKTKRGAAANVNETFRNYDPDELEKLLKESQKGKFS